ncbi:MAG: Riboflavin biosynthesis protein RibD [Rhodocyclaceae bacterium]|nr:MAG: bifunctional diaminohydroxyphosphoribosylaminopyrimidine deaminase/5-amino-6-(5-phosphoribosylamino)uracil reductase RibD [Rhodocyclaceae bacterium]MBV6407617.1 Riboflavin biosynthesis protein RibD [Rhodocyclaceae bacterium]CAG0930210.1 diaminohydroxyphosphoribosylaminopyrimidine deaminase / 5-amino-6-(5-phosphoribosylamino)uracil reductase [Rhodocyclaceae bacterium]
MAFTASDHEYMARALRLAEKGLFTTTPNPRVGCVLVRDGAVVGEGWHERAGEAHAETRALQAAGERARGAAAYVTLEPCSHHGRTPPCSDALIAAGVARVVAAMRDPNPQVAGQGLAQLRAAGIEVADGLLAHEARELNIGFASRMERGRPWLRLKLAASLDGKTALANGKSQWITGPEARRDGHAWRARACAILTGAGTVRDDDPRLTARDVETPRQPLRVVVDSHCETPPAARILDGGNTLVAAAFGDAAKIAALRAAGGEVVMLPNENGKVDLPHLMRLLAGRGVNELHVEAGHKLNGSLLREGLVDELLLYFAPTILGSGREMFPLPEIADLAGRRNLKILDLRRVGGDIRILARLLPA